MKTFIIVLAVLFLSAVSFTQTSTESAEAFNTFEGGIGMTWIDGTAYTTFSITPDLSFGKIGIGLNIELLFNNSDGFKFRKTGWDKGAGILRAIRYIRYGQKYDPIYARIGTIDAATLGHGFIMWYYSNTADYDQRKIGLELDIDFKQFGFESTVSNLGDKEIYGIRGYFRPLVSYEMPIISNLEIGATMVTDRSANKIETDPLDTVRTDVTEYGFDIGLPIIKKEMFTTTLYYDLAKIVDYGSGNAFGIKVDITGVMNLFNLSAKMEKRFLGEKFIPNYFNTLYELDRSLGTNLLQLENMGKTEGIFGELSGNVVGKIKLMGNFQKLNAIDHSGIMHLEAKMPDLIPNVRLQATYDKTGIETLEDARTLDHHSIAIAEMGYRTYKFIYISIRYRWNFIYNEEKNRYEPQERVEPRISFAYDF